MMSGSEIPEAPATTAADPINVWLVEDSESYRGAMLRALGQIEGLRCTGAFARCAFVPAGYVQQFTRRHRRHLDVHVDALRQWSG